MGFDNPVDINYTITCERIPNYVIGEEYPADVRLGKVGKSISIIGENIGGLISYRGKEIAEVSITPKNINNISRGQTLTCLGIITAQKLTVSNGGLVKGSISVSESVR